VVRAALFALVGLVFLTHWLVTDPSYEMSDSQDEGNHVLAFSAVILSLAAAIPMVAQLVHGPFAFRASLVAATGAAFASFANILEDGLGMGWAFFAFVLGTAILLLGLLVLTVVIALGGRGGPRLLALVPAGTSAAIIFYVIAGGPLMLATWLVAAALALALPARTVVEATPAAP
jgi:hypothetical protein